MNKIIILRDCTKCPYSENWADGYMCWKMGSWNLNKEIPDWCPLLKLPEYKDEPTLDGWNIGDPITEELTDWLINFGYNQCLHEILNEKED